jgi:hypothetical protein
VNERRWFHESGSVLWYNWVGQQRYLLRVGRCVDGDMVGRFRALSKVVKDWRAFDRNRWLLVPGQVCNGRFVESCPGIYVDSILDLVCGL